MQTLNADTPITEPENIVVQQRLNAIIIGTVNRTLLPIFDILHHAPTAAMCADVSLVLINFGVNLYKAFLAAFAPLDEGSFQEDALKTATGFANAYGSPIVGGLTNNLDLRPFKNGGLPPPTAQISSAQPGSDAWRDKAQRVLTVIAEDLMQRGLVEGFIRGSSQHLEMLLDTAQRAPMTIIVTVRISSIQHEPFILEITAVEGLTPTTLVRSRSVPYEHLLHTVDAFLAGLKLRAPSILVDSSKPPVEIAD